MAPIEACLRRQADIRRLADNADWDRLPMLSVPFSLDAIRVPLAAIDWVLKQEIQPNQHCY